MMTRTSWFLAILALLLSTQVFAAGPLFNHPNAGGPPPVYTGSTPFAQGTLSGYVDYAVFNPGQFPYSGYTPTAGELTYAYQITVTGSAPLSSFEVLLSNPADHIGHFNDIGTVAPNSEVLLPNTSAKWTFAGIPGGASSMGLAFSSPTVPELAFGSVVDTGQSAYVIPLPTPSSLFVPEPASLGLVAFGSLLLALRRRSR